MSQMSQEVSCLEPSLPSQLGGNPKEVLEKRPDFVPAPPGKRDRVPSLKRKDSPPQSVPDTSNTKESPALMGVQIRKQSRNGAKNATNSFPRTDQPLLFDKVLILLLPAVAIPVAVALRRTSEEAEKAVRVDCPNPEEEEAGTIQTSSHSITG